MKKIFFIILIIIILNSYLFSICAEGIIFKTQNYNEYLEFVKNTPLLVTYDDVKGIGEFKSFSHTNVLAEVEGEYSMHTVYSYGFIDKSKKEVLLRIQHYDEGFLVEPTELTDNQINIDDMRHAATAVRNSIYKTDNIIYYYINGELFEVLWNIDGTYFSFLVGPDANGDYSFKDYPCDEYPDSFVSKLVNLKTAQQAIADMDTIQYIEKPIDSSNTVIWCLIGATAVIGIAVAVIIIKKKK